MHATGVPEPMAWKGMSDPGAEVPGRYELPDLSAGRRALALVLWTPESSLWPLTNFLCCFGWFPSIWEHRVMMHIAQGWFSKTPNSRSPETFPFVTCQAYSQRGCLSVFQHLLQSQLCVALLHSDRVSYERLLILLYLVSVSGDCKIYFSFLFLSQDLTVQLLLSGTAQTKLALK